MSAGLVVRILYLLVVVDDRAPLSDADQYLDIARNVARGRGMAMQWPQLHVHPTAFRPPVFPLLLGGWIRVFGSSVFAARSLNALIGLGVIAATYLVSCRLGGRRAGLVAALLVTLYPPLLANDATTLAEPLGLLLLIGMLASFLSRRWWALGLLGGLLTLTKPAAQGLLVPVLLVVIGLCLRDQGEGREWRRAALAAATVLGCAGAVVAPWVVRNHVRLGTTAIVTSNGFTLTAIYAEAAQQHGSFLDPVYGAPYQSLDERLLRWDEGRWNDELVDRALKGIRRHPTYVADVVWRNLGRWFELTPSRNDDPERLDGRHLSVRHWSLPAFYLITVAGFAGLVVGVRSGGTARRGAAFLLLTSAYFTAMSLPLVATPRLRAPLDLACCVGCGLLAAAWTGRRHHPDQTGALPTHPRKDVVDQ